MPAASKALTGRWHAGQGSGVPSVRSRNSRCLSSSFSSCSDIVNSSRLVMKPLWVDGQGERSAVAFSGLSSALGDVGIQADDDVLAVDLGLGDLVAVRRGNDQSLSGAAGNR